VRCRWYVITFYTFDSTLTTFKGGLLTGQILGGAGVRYLPRMKIQMTVAAVITTAFVAAVAASNAGTRNQTTGLLLIGTIAAGYIENLTLSSTAYLWDPADMGLVTGVMGTHSIQHYFLPMRLIVRRCYTYRSIRHCN
jgi:hypothetical protein